MKLWSYLIFLISTSMFSQQTIALNGLITTQRNNSVTQANIVNLSTNATAVSNENGYFTIEVKLNDALKISHIQYEEFYVKIDETTLKNKVITIKLNAKNYELDNVNIVKLDAQKLRIINYTPKKYTVAERRLRTAGQFKPYQLILIPFGGMPLDPVFNAISGRTAMLKKEVEIEKKEKLVEQLNLSYTDAVLQTKYHIPQEYTEGFRYFLAENAEFSNLYKLSNSIKTDLKMSELSVEYLKIINEK